MAPPVSIKLKRCHRVGVTRDGLNSFYVATDCDEICRQTVPEIVHPELRTPRRDINRPRPPMDGSLFDHSSKVKDNAAAESQTILMVIHSVRDVGIEIFRLQYAHGEMAVEPIVETTAGRKRDAIR